MATVISCPICFEYFKNNDEVHSTSCGHVYHFQCLDKWRHQSTLCPQCRYNCTSSHRVYFSLVEESEVSQKFAEIKQNYEKTEKTLVEVEKDKNLLQLELGENVNTITVLKNQIDELVTKLSALETKLEEDAEKLEKLNSQFDESVLNGSRIELELETVKKEFLEMQNECSRANEQTIDLKMQLETMQVDRQEKDDQLQVLCLEKHELEKQVNQMKILKIKYLDEIKTSSHLSFTLKKLRLQTN